MSSISPAILLTGASTGIGEACALELDRRRFRVFAGVRSQTAGQALQAKASPSLTPVLLDVTDGALIAAAAETIGKAVGEAGLLGLVNNAGIAVPGPLEMVPIEALRRQFEVNVIGQVAVTQAFLPLLRKAQGRIVNISSINGAFSPPFLGPYAASKFALEAISDALRLELRTWNIHVSLVEPGPIDTPIWKKSSASLDQLSRDDATKLHGLYANDLAVMRDVTAQLVRKVAPASRVVHAVVHALTARRPKPRYYLGWDVRFMSKGFRMVPERLRDWIVCRLTGLR